MVGRAPTIICLTYVPQLRDIGSSGKLIILTLCKEVLTHPSFGRIQLEMKETIASS